MTQEIKTTILILAILASLAVVGEMDYQDEIARNGTYCSGLSAGKWVDYNPSVNCK